MLGVAYPLRSTRRCWPLRSGQSGVSVTSSRETLEMRSQPLWASGSASGAGFRARTPILCWVERSGQPVARKGITRRRRPRGSLCYLALAPIARLQRRRSDRRRPSFGPRLRGLGREAAEATLRRQPDVLARRGAGPAIGETGSSRSARVWAKTQQCGVAFAHCCLAQAAAMLWACGLLQRASRPSLEQAAGRRDRDRCLAWRNNAVAQRPAARQRAGHSRRLLHRRADPAVSRSR